LTGLSASDPHTKVWDKCTAKEGYGSAGKYQQDKEEVD
jgi:hypothetical protein